MRASLFLTALPAATIAIACGPSADDAPSREVASAAPAAAAAKTAVDACALVTQAEAAARHWSVGYAPTRTGQPLRWEYETPEGTCETTLPVRVVVHDAETYIACCRAGLGLDIAEQRERLARKARGDGDLVARHHRYQPLGRCGGGAKEQREGGEQQPQSTPPAPMTAIE